MDTAEITAELQSLLDCCIAAELAAMPSAELAPWQFNEAELLAELEQARRVRDQHNARWLALLAEAEKREACLRRDSVPTSNWLVNQNSHSARSARNEVRLAMKLVAAPMIADAFAAGRMSTEQAAAIVNGLERLPGQLDQQQREQITQQLVGFAGEFGPSGLARLVNRAVEVVAPEIAEDADRKAVERLDAQQRRDRYLTWRQDLEGAWIINGKLPTLVGEQLIGVLRALASKHRKQVLLTGEPIARSQAAADALVTLVDHFQSCGVAPTYGADRPRVIITIDHETLCGKLGTATLLSTDQPITAAKARRLACDADILPVVMNGNSVPLDVGRERRLFTNELRQLLILRDRGCTLPGCDRPPAETEAHHRRPWWDGGQTSLDNGVLLCSFHHHLVEPNPNGPPDRQWLIRLDHRGLPEFAAPLRPGQTQRIWRQHERFRGVG